MRKELIIGIILVILVGGSLLFIFATGTDTTDSVFDTNRTPYVEIANPSGFLNTPLDASGQPRPITIGQFVGKKVILVDFMTYSCINCQRTFPYMNAWHEEYNDQGLQIIAIHTPEFAFEHDIGNVREAMERFGIAYPVVLDNDYSTWSAYGNRYWPRKYLIDIRGEIVYDHVGEGAYEETESKIRELLEERAQILDEEAVATSDDLSAAGIRQADIRAGSPETYFGSDRNELIGNGTPGRGGEQTFTLPERFLLNRLYLGGTWDITAEYAQSAADDAVVVYRYNAQDVYVVAEADAPVDIEVLQDGAPVGDASGGDISSDAILRIGESRLYKLIHNEEQEEHLLELRIKDPDLRIYTFTFG